MGPMPSQVGERSISWHLMSPRIVCLEQFQSLWATVWCRNFSYWKVTNLVELFLLLSKFWKAYKLSTFLGTIYQVQFLSSSQSSVSSRISTFNMFAGEVPKGGIFSNLSAILVEGNSKLCGGIEGLQLPPCDVENQKYWPKSSNLKSVGYQHNLLDFLRLGMYFHSSPPGTKVPKRNNFLCQFEKSVHETVILRTL